MAGGLKKSTKKFQKHHLKDTLEKRKEHKKVKQREQVKAKKKARHAADNENRTQFQGGGGEGGGGGEAARSQDVARDLSKMSVDEFFQGGFELPQKMQKSSKGKNDSSKKRKRQADEDAEELDEDRGSESSESLGGEDLEEYKGELKALEEKDPDFYKYLQENDAELLDFEKMDEDAEIELSEDDESEEKTSRETSTLDLDTVRKWKTAMKEQHSLRATRQAVLAFRAAAFLNSDEPKEQRYTISNSEIYHEVLMTNLEGVPLVLNQHLPVKESHGKVHIATDSKRFKTLSPFLQSYTSSILQLLSTLSDASTIKLTLTSINPLLPYILSFKKLLRLLVKNVVSIYSTSSSTDSATIITAFLVLRRLFLISDASTREAILKHTYQGLVTSARTTNSHTLPNINLMKNSSVELWSLDPSLSYSVGFVSLRQLAVHLRSTITHPTKDSYKAVYNWQYTHSLDFFSRILSTTCSPATVPTLKRPADSPLHPLIYPLVQITLGALRLIPTPTYYPLRFHLTRSLLRISRTTTTYIPLAPALIEVLQSPELSKPPKPSTLAPLDFNTVLRAPKSYLRTRVYQDGVGAQVQELLATFFATWSRNIAFPELQLPPSVMLKRWLKLVSGSPSPSSNNSRHPQSHNPKTPKGGGMGGGGNKNPKLNSLISLLVQKMTSQATMVEKARKTVMFTSADREEVDRFMADVEEGDTVMGAFAETLRRTREEREKVVERGRRADERKRREEGKEVEEGKMTVNGERVKGKGKGARRDNGKGGMLKKGGAAVGDGTDEDMDDVGSSPDDQ